MASTKGLIEAESSNDDSVSLTSTVMSEQQEEYVIDGGVLAEQNDNGTILYLVKWEGYGEDRNSWEPADCFASEMTLKEWETDKIRIAKGTKKAFDVAAWEKRKWKIDEKTDIRRQRRQQKKQSLNQEIDLLHSGDEASDDVREMVPERRVSSKRVASKALSSKDDSALSVQHGKRLFTDKEDRALEAGLQREGGPFWSKIREMYGANGTVSQDLVGRSMLDLQERAFEMKMDFERHGRDVPEWLKPVTMENYPRRSNPALIEQLVEETPQASRKHGGSSNAEPRLNHGPLKIATRLPKISKLGAESPQQTDLGIAAPSKPYTGTGRFSEAASLTPKSPRLGILGAGPTRLRRSEPVFSKPRRKASVTAMDVMTNWSAKSKERNVDPDRASVAKGEPAKHFKKLSSQNRFNKRARNEPAPDPDRLIFIDRKTGKAPKDVAAPSPVFQSPQGLAKTPMQKFRDGLAAKDDQVGETHIDVEADDAGTNTEVTGLRHVDGVTSVPNGGDKGVFKDIEDKSNRTGDVEQRIYHDVELKGSNTADCTTPSADVRATSDVRSSDKAKAGDISTPHNLHKNQTAQWTPPSTKPGGPGEGRRKPESTSTSIYVQPSASTNASSTASTRPAPTQLSSNHLGLRDPTEMSFIINPSLSAVKNLFKTHSPHLIIGQLKLGADDQVLPKVKFEGISREVHKLFLSIKIMPSTLIFEFTSFCMAPDYQAFFNAVGRHLTSIDFLADCFQDTSDVLGSGYIVSYPESQHVIESYAKRLAYDISGGLFFADRFTMLIYPVGADAWSFLDKDLPCPPDGAVLRFVVAKPMPKGWANDESAELLALKEANPERYQEIERKIQARPVLSGEKNINVVFHDMFEIDFNRLISQNGPQQPPENSPFFLFFIPSGCDEYEPDPVKRQALRLRTSEEHDFFVEFLEANGVEDIYSSQDVGSLDPQTNGAWDYFRKNVKSGVIVVSCPACLASVDLTHSQFHHDCIRKDWIPGLGRLLHNVGINVWRMSMEPMDLEPHPHLVRLYPHGGVILLTQSLLLYRPREALRLLRWFRHILLPAKVPLTWKVAVRPRVCEWLFDVCKAIHYSEKDLFGSGGQQVFADLCLELYELLWDENTHSLVSSWDSHTPGDKSPMIAASRMRPLQKRKEWKGTGPNTEIDHKHIRQNDDQLVQWISEYALFYCHLYRKFHCVIGFKDAQTNVDRTVRRYEELYGHLEIFTPDRFFKRHEVTPESTLNKIEEERARKVHDSLEKDIAEAEEAWRDGRETAKFVLESIKQNYMELGLDERQAAEKAKDYLIEGGSSPREFIGCEVNMDYRRSEEFIGPLPSASGDTDDDSEAEHSEDGSNDSNDEDSQADKQGNILSSGDEAMDANDGNTSETEGLLAGSVDRAHGNSRVEQGDGDSEIQTGDTGNLSDLIESENDMDIAPTSPNEL